jgi:hypothetical protein
MVGFTEHQRVKKNGLQTLLPVVQAFKENYFSI